MSQNPAFSDEVPESEMHEGESEGEGHAVPADLLELHEVLEWQAAVDAED